MLRLQLFQDIYPLPDPGWPGMCQPICPSRLQPLLLRPTLHWRTPTDHLGYAEMIDGLRMLKTTAGYLWALALAVAYLNTWSLFVLGEKTGIERATRERASLASNAVGNLLRIKLRSTRPAAVSQAIKQGNEWPCSDSRFLTGHHHCTSPYPAASK